MGPNSYLLSVISAAAIRLILGADAGLDYDTTAMSALDRDFDGEADERTPWALRIRPDILLSWFNQQHYVYLMGNGAYVQPFSFEGAEYGDNPEGNGEIDLGARLRLGRRLTFHPGAYVRLMSSNSFAQSQDEVSGTSIGTAQFNTLSYGGFLEFEFPVGRRLRFFVRAEVESWYLEECISQEDGGSEQGSFLCIPREVLEVQPTLSIYGVFSGVIAVTRRDGIAAEIAVNEGLFLNDAHAGDQYDRNDMLNLTGRIIYRRYWTPYLMTDLSVGLTALRPRGEEEIAPGEWVLAGGWQLNLVGALSLIWFGRPRWLTMNLTYERAYDQLHFRNSGAVVDSINLLAIFGPFEGFGLSVGLTWSRFGYEVPRLANCADPMARSCSDPATCEVVCDPEPCEGEDCGNTCDVHPTQLRTINTIGLTLDLHYLHDVGNLAFGPFFEGYVYAQLPEEITEGTTGDAYPIVDQSDCYLPPHFDPVEAVLLLGFRLQWGYGNARPRRGQAGGTNAARGSREERRLAVARATRDERRTPGYVYGARPMIATAADERALFGDNDPLGRMYGGEQGLAPWVREEREREAEAGEDREPGDGEEEGEVEEWEWFGEERPEEGEGGDGDGEGEDDGPILFGQD